MKKFQIKLSNMKIESVIMLLMAVLLLFVAIGQFADADSLAALLAGFSLRFIMPHDICEKVQESLRLLVYSIFAPIFFVLIGKCINIGYLSHSVWLLVAVFLVSASAKFIATFIVAYKKLGTHMTIILALGLTVRFSFSIIIINILYETGLVDVNLYSVMVASNAVFLLIMPTIFSLCVGKWKSQIDNQGEIAVEHAISEVNVKNTIIPDVSGDVILSQQTATILTNNTLILPVIVNNQQDNIQIIQSPKLPNIVPKNKI